MNEFMAKKTKTVSMWWPLATIPLVLFGIWIYTTTMRLEQNENADLTQPVLVYYTIPTETDFDFVAVERGVPRTDDMDALALSALREWVKGPTDLEKAQGMGSSLNEGAEVNSVKIESGQATVDFNDKFDTPMGGSARVMSIGRSIERIMKQFGVDGMANITLTINNGERAAVLEP